MNRRGRNKGTGKCKKYRRHLGNEEYYYMAEKCVSFATSALVPIVAAGKARELTFHSGIKTVEKVTVSSLVGKGASEPKIKF